MYCYDHSRLIDTSHCYRSPIRTKLATRGVLFDWNVCCAWINDTFARDLLYHNYFVENPQIVPTVTQILNHQSISCEGGNIDGEELKKMFKGQKEKSGYIHEDMRKNNAQLNTTFSDNYVDRNTNAYDMNAIKTGLDEIKNYREDLDEIENQCKQTMKTRPSQWHSVVYQLPPS